MDLKFDIFNFDDCIGKKSLHAELVAHEKVGHAPPSVIGVDGSERKLPFPVGEFQQQAAYRAMHYDDTDLLFHQSDIQSRS